MKSHKVKKKRGRRARQKRSRGRPRTVTPGARCPSGERARPHGAGAGWTHEAERQRAEALGLDPDGLDRDSRRRIMQDQAAGSVIARARARGDISAPQYEAAVAYWTRYEIWRRAEGVPGRQLRCAAGGAPPEPANTRDEADQARRAREALDTVRIALRALDESTAALIDDAVLTDAEPPAEKWHRVAQGLEVLREWLGIHTLDDEQPCRAG